MRLGVTNVYGRVSQERAKELANKIAAERGSDIGAQSFHQYLEADRLRCTVAPSRPAAWRIKRTQVRLSAFAACTLANANLLDFHDLKLFRPQEYYTDEGPWDPISGGAAACFRAFSGMAIGLAEVPSETLKPFYNMGWSNRQQTRESVSTIAGESRGLHIRGTSTPPTSSEQSQTSLHVQKSVTHIQNLPKLSGLSSPTSNVGSSSISNVLQGQLSPKQDNACRSRVRSGNEPGFRKGHDMLRQTGVQTSRGLGRFVKATVQAPMEISMGLTKGFHNFPKLWGDDTVRPQERISDFKSGVMAAGKEFGFGWYDGVTGLITHPWKGAQKEGTGGFVKGIGKGLGGFVTKPFAALSGILSHTMKGVHKEVQKLFGSSVQNYIITSRVAQGYEEWLQSSDAEKQDVIVRWKLIQKCLKTEFNPDEMVHGVLEAQRKKNIEDTKASQNCRHITSSAQSASADAPTLDLESVTLAIGGSQSSEELLEAAEINEAIRLSIQETSHRSAEDDTNMEQAIQENASQLQRQRQNAADHEAEQENLSQAIAISETEFQRHASEALEYKKQLKRTMVQTLREQRRRGSHSGWESHRGDEDQDEFERVIKHSENMAGKAAAVTDGPPNVQQPSSYNPGHLEGTTQSEFEAQQEGQQGGKTPQERTEEKIVVDYVKKQSLLEVHHQNKGKGRATVIEDEDDEDLQKALKLSMQGHEHDAEYRCGKASGL